MINNFTMLTFDLTANSQSDYMRVGETMHYTAVGVKIKKLHPDAVIPTYATSDSSGFDLVAIEDAVLKPQDTILVKTGLAVQIPSGFELQIRPRSGLSFKTQLVIPNSPGTVDADYRGELCVIMKHSGMKSMNDYADEKIFIRKGDRVAQGVICPVTKAIFEVAESLDETVRGEGRLGSTGSTVITSLSGAIEALQDTIKKGGG